MESLWIAIGDKETVLEVDEVRTIIKHKQDANCVEEVE